MRRAFVAEFQVTTNPNGHDDERDAGNEVAHSRDPRVGLPRSLMTEKGTLLVDCAWLSAFFMGANKRGRSVFPFRIIRAENS